MSSSSSTTTTTPYVVERLKAGLRQVRPVQMDDLWTVVSSCNSNDDDDDDDDDDGHDCRPWGMANDLGHCLVCGKSRLVV
jgi:hypothetical protein